MKQYMITIQTVKQYLNNITGSQVVVNAKNKAQAEIKAGVICNIIESETDKTSAYCIYSFAIESMP